MTDYLIDSNGKAHILREEHSVSSSGVSGKYGERPADSGVKHKLQYGNFEVKRELSRETFSIIYKGLDVESGRETFIKAMRLSASDDKDIGCFISAVSKVSCLNSPNILHIYGMGNVGCELYIAEEYVDGGTLRDILCDGKIPDSQEIGRRLAIFRDVLQAIDYAHSKNIVHCDLKPENVLIASNGHAKVTNFACSIWKNTENLVPAATQIDMPAYISPEQAKGELPDFRSDIFSLGVMLYELVTGRLPFRANSSLTPAMRVSKIIKKIISKKPVSPISLNHSINPALSSLIMSMLCKEPSERIQNVAEVIRLFDEASACQSEFPSSADVSYVMSSSCFADEPLRKVKNGVCILKFGYHKKSAIALILVAALYFGYILYIERQSIFELKHAEVEPSVSCQSFELGSYVKFGRYPQTNAQVLEPIEWLVLENNGKTALLISKYALDCHFYHYIMIPISWRDCDLRKWLNTEFIHTAFNDEELDRISESKIYTGDNAEYGTKGCGETADRIFCLSIEEANNYFASDDERKCLPTSYAILRNCYYNMGNGCCSFWLRSPGSYVNKVSSVLYDGSVSSSGHGADVKGNSVRPSLRVML